MVISRKPNLFLVGEQKAGTSSLHKMLSMHPEIAMSHLKEPGYFCTDFHEESDRYHKNNKYFSYRNINDYLKLFESHGKEDYLGESSSIYFYSATALSNIAAFNKDAKIVLLLRDPVTFLPSLHSQYIKEGGEDIVSFEKALDTENDRKRGLYIPKKIAAPSLLYYSQRVLYGKYLERLLDFFGRGSVFIGFFEDFILDTHKFYDEIIDFLNISPFPLETVIKENARKSRRFKNLYDCINNQKLKSVINKNIPIRYQLVIKKYLDTVFLKDAPPQVLADDIAARITQMCSDDILKLERILGRKTPWNWANEK